MLMSDTVDGNLEFSRRKTYRGRKSLGIRKRQFPNELNTSCLICHRYKQICDKTNTTSCKRIVSSLSIPLRTIPKAGGYCRDEGLMCVSLEELNNGLASALSAIHADEYAAAGDLSDDMESSGLNPSTIGEPVVSGSVIS
ncbi:Uncharacterized protein HZ326_18597 [Fusarium oxysporum f. sp. albedinis]|nr:hypothetical protein HZ326_22127 [Fusarium oxysporum f. sp. albedinis]KAJ0138479.1 Uncharacterized protein HZ326_18597 [Fusarium oxysporum f. sp. albedinis]